MATTRQQYEASVRRNNKRTGRIIRRYETVWDRVRKEIAEVQNVFKENPEYVVGSAALVALTEALTTELRQAATAVADTMEPTVLEAITRSQNDIAERLKAAGLTPPSHFNAVVDTEKAHIAATRLQQNVTTAAKNVTDTIAEVSTKLYPTVSTVNVLGRRALRVEGQRAATAVTTEEARAFRHAATDQYQLADVGWTWQAQLDASTCGYCWGQHGTEHDASEDMATHPNCVCSQVPTTNRGLISGEERFDRLSESKQIQIIGPVAAYAYRNGEIRLSDLGTQKVHPVWGPVGGTQPLKNVVGVDRATVLRRKVLFGR